ncbi:amino acid ABC transporter ATP-binding protein [Anaerotardibacter muris]|uniref:amino acid ABC transporter ATP-binding protein n=1 Tax=Anaerotardibacter muris TaxID=2941505 RepID=UPI00203BD40A|nr:amino acid ABC transporter ATP-binding protein [Anaerotardibacter muris]
MRVKLEHLCRSFDGVEVLHDISFDEEVASLAIIGPSGGGKSTLLRIIGGLLAPTSGSMEIDGDPIEFDEAALRNYRTTLGFVFQDGGLFHHLDALENVALPLRTVHHLSEDEAQSRSLELLERLGLADSLKKRPAQLSGGQKQRVAIARALAVRPRLLLLDEPTSALDPEFTTEVLDVVRDLKDEGTRFIIVTHEMGFARHACDKVAFLYDGRLLEHGDAARIFDQPQTAELKRFLSRLLEWSI